jgi:hypothetical protein
MKIKREATPYTTVIAGHKHEEWRSSPDGTHVPLPLDVSQVSDAVVQKVALACLDYTARAGTYAFDGMARAAIAALAAALGEVE